GQDITLGFVNTGGRYDPLTDTWRPTSTLDAASGRAGHSAVWTGSRMIIWGGTDNPSSTTINTGGRYDPISDTWAATTTAGAPAARFGPTAVWTGSLMVIWGGGGFSPVASGGRYDPAADFWTPTAFLLPLSPRSNHSAVWTG